MENLSGYFVAGAVVSDIDAVVCALGRSYNYVIKSNINKIEANVFTKIDLSVFTEDMLESITKYGKITSDTLRFDRVVFEDTTSTWMYVDDDGVTRYFTPSTDASENAKILESLSKYTLIKAEG